MQANPLRRIRKSAGLTQKEVAIGAGITPQVVLKAEQGLFGMVPPRLISVLAEVSGFTESEVERNYKEWQAAVRRENREVILNKLANEGPPIYTYGEFQAAVADSTNSFCKLLCLHPAQWTRLKREGGDAGFFEEAMKEAELEWLLSNLKN